METEILKPYLRGWILSISDVATESFAYFGVVEQIIECFMRGVLSGLMLLMNLKVL